MNKTNYITLTAASGQEDALSDFLIGGAQLVKETEPETLLWTALQSSESEFCIFDAFPNEAAQNAHFSGKVAAALNENAATLIQGGWDRWCS